MKKFIVLILVLAIFGGIGYFYLSNSMVMTAMFSQNTGKVMIMHNKAYNKLSEYKGYNLTFTQKTSTGDGVEKTVFSSEIKIKKVEGGYDLRADVTNKLTETETSPTYFFSQSEGKMYTLVGESKTFVETTFAEVLVIVTNNNAAEVLRFMDYENLGKLTEETVEVNFASCSITAKFSPLYIGCKLAWQTEETAEGAYTKSCEKIDAACTLREQYTITHLDEDNYVSTSFKVNKPGKKVAVAMPSDAETYVAA